MIFFLTPFEDNITLTSCLIIGYNYNKYNLQNILYNKYHNKRLISNDANVMDIRNLVNDADFYEWLRGFTDAEGCFSIFK